MHRRQPESVYRITVEGRLDPEWAAWLNDLTLTSAEVDGQPVTTLTGPVADQVALRGILNKLWDLKLTMVSVTRIT